MIPPEKQPDEPETRRAGQTRSCIVCGADLRDDGEHELYCSPRCRTTVWRRSRRRAGLGPQPQP